MERVARSGVDVSSSGVSTSQLKSLEGAKKDLERVCKDKEGFISTSYKQRVTSLQVSCLCQIEAGCRFSLPR